MSNIFTDYFYFSSSRFRAYDRWESAVNTRDELIKQAYALIMGQCSVPMRNRLKAHKRWETVNKANDVIGLLEIIREALYAGGMGRYTAVFTLGLRPHASSICAAKKKTLRLTTSTGSNSWWKATSPWVESPGSVKSLSERPSLKTSLTPRQPPRSR
eukprot:scaffold10958_cov107-Cylindrotheca_fusiformis.AAC.2